MGTGTTPAAAGRPVPHTSVPNIARVYDYLLGGKEAYAADRALADRMEKLAGAGRKL